MLLRSRRCLLPRRDDAALDATDRSRAATSPCLEIAADIADAQAAAFTPGRDSALDTSQLQAAAPGRSFHPTVKVPDLRAPNRPQVQVELPRHGDSKIEPHLVAVFPFRSSASRTVTLTVFWSLFDSVISTCPISTVSFCRRASASSAVLTLNSRTNSIFTLSVSVVMISAFARSASNFSVPPGGPERTFQFRPVCRTGRLSLRRSVWSRRSKQPKGGDKACDEWGIELMRVFIRCGVRPWG